MYKDDINLPERIFHTLEQELGIGLNINVCEDAANIIRKKMGDTDEGIPFIGIKMLNHYEELRGMDYFSTNLLGALHEYSSSKVGKDTTAITHESTIPVGYIALSFFPSGKVIMGDFVNITDTPSRTIHQTGAVKCIYQEDRSTALHDIVDRDIKDISEDNDFCKVMKLVYGMVDDKDARHCVFTINLYTSATTTIKSGVFFNRKKSQINERFFFLDALIINSPKYEKEDEDEPEIETVFVPRNIDVRDVLRGMLKNVSGEIELMKLTPAEAMREFMGGNNTGVKDVVNDKMNVVKPDPIASKREAILDFFEDNEDHYLEGELDPVLYQDSMDEINSLIHNDVILSGLSSVAIDFDNESTTNPSIKLSDLRGELYSRFVSQIKHSRVINGNIENVNCKVEVVTDAVNDISSGIIPAEPTDVISAVVLSKHVDEKDSNDIKYSLAWVIRAGNQDGHLFYQRLDVL